MLYILLVLLVPVLTGVLNRYARGEGKWERRQFYGFHALLAGVLTLDPVFATAWLVFVLLYGIPPTHALFSALHRRPPARDDSVWFQWMRDGAAWVTRHLPAVTVSELWVRYAVVYGVFRALPMVLFGVSFFCGYKDSLVPLVGLVFLGLGFFFKTSRKLCDRFEVHHSLGVPLTEFFVGWLCGAYLLMLAR